MLDGKYKPGEAVVRVKTDMTLKNPALEGLACTPYTRHLAHPHPRPEIGSSYSVWPLLDFQSAVEDHLQGVTHIVRGKDLMDSTRKQTLLYEHFGWQYPETLYWGRVKVHEWGGFSTSQMRTDIEAVVTVAGMTLVYQRLLHFAIAAFKPMLFVHFGSNWASHRRTSLSRCPPCYSQHKSR